MTGQACNILNKDGSVRKVSKVVGIIEWGTDSAPLTPKLRYVYTTDDEKDEEGNLIVIKREAKRVKLHK